jgi:predicted amidohydrolase
MADRFRVTLAQLNPTLGDLAGNVAKARAAWEEGRAGGADIVMLPEMFVTGYQTQDLVMKPAFHRDAMRQVEALAREITGGPILAIGGAVARGGQALQRVSPAAGRPRRGAQAQDREAELQRLRRGADLRLGAPGRSL